jgi:hypothetical protein
LARLPDLGKALREAPPEIKRQVFASFSEAVADAFQNAEALLAEDSSAV